MKELRKELEKVIGIETVKTVYLKTETEAEAAKKEGHEVTIMETGGENYGYYTKAVECSDEALDMMVTIKQTKDLATIKNCMIFIVVLASIGVVAGLIFGFKLMSAFSGVSRLLR